MVESIAIAESGEAITEDPTAAAAREKDPALTAKSSKNSRRLSPLSLESVASADIATRLAADVLDEESRDDLHGGTQVVQAPAWRRSAARITLRTCGFISANRVNGVTSPGENKATLPACPVTN